MSVGTQYDIEFDQGSTFQWDITVYNTDGVTPLDISSMTVRSMLRKQYSDAAPTETMNITYPNAALGQVRLTLSAAETAAMLKGRYVYDVELEDAVGVVVKLYKGYAIVYPEATK